MNQYTNKTLHNFFRENLHYSKCLPQNRSFFSKSISRSVKILTTTKLKSYKLLWLKLVKVSLIQVYDVIKIVSNQTLSKTNYIFSRNWFVVTTITKSFRLTENYPKLGGSPWVWNSQKFTVFYQMKEIIIIDIKLIIIKKLGEIEWFGI